MPVANNTNLTKIFVYGTLKKGQPNYDKLTERNAEFVDSAMTVDKWPLVVATHANIPFLLDKKGYGHVRIHYSLIIFSIKKLNKTSNFP